MKCKPNLIQHHAVHTGVRNHKCNVCGKRFSRPFFLQTHMRTHTGERPYICDICGRGFAQPTDMRRHRKRHEKSSNMDEPVFYVLEEQLEESEDTGFTEVVIESCADETVELKVETCYD